MFLSRLVIAIVMCCLGAQAIAQDRMPPIPPEKYTEAQKKAADQFLETRKTPVFGPFIPLMRSPELMLRSKEMGDYLRFRASIGQKLAEFTILITARQWTQDYEWYVHHPLALKQGLKPEAAEAVFVGRRPSGMAEDEEALYDLVTELDNTRRLSDATYDRALKKFGEQGVMDIIGIHGYYTFLAMTMNATRMELPKDAKRFPRIPE
jgi:4-carboxymuconolactone decarboxylase